VTGTLKAWNKIADVEPEALDKIVDRRLQPGVMARAS
jgi:hypothetical protein